MPRTNEVSINGRFNMAPSAVVIRQITTGDVASGAVAAARRFETRERELRMRFETELQAVRDAFLQELAGFDFE